MIKRILASGLALGLFAPALSAQEYTPEELIQIANNAGVCPDTGVATAVLQDDGSILATCNEDATGFLPILPAAAGGLGPAVAGLVGVGALAAAGGGGGGSTPDTQ